MRCADAVPLRRQVADNHGRTVQLSLLRPGKFSATTSLGCACDGTLTLVSPDIGNAKRARIYADRLGGELAIIDKRRINGTDTAAYSIIGDVKGKTVLMVDDIIATAGTVVQAVNLVRERGAKRVIVAATHGVLCGPAIERLRKAPIDHLAVTDSIPISAEKRAALPFLTVLSVSELLGEAIRRIHRNESVSSLFLK